MFHLFSYCWSWLQAIQEPMRKMTLLVLGLDGAGKSSLVREIQRVLSCELLPTTKPNQMELRVDRFEVSLVDLAGGQRSWGTWKDHFSTAHGIIFVLDSSDVARVDEAKKTLSRVLGHPTVSGKPLLLLANKQDKMDALLPCEIIERLSLEKLANESKSLCRIEPCSATKKLPRIQCWTIVQGLHWLLHTIAINYGVLCARIYEDGPERQASPEREISKKAQRSGIRMRENRESRARRKGCPEENAKTDESKTTKLSENILSQKEEKALASKKRKGKVKLKVKKKSLVQSEDTLAEDDSGKLAMSGSKVGAIAGLLHSNKVAQENPRGSETSPPPPGQRPKKKNKILKNKIKTQESSQSQPNENLSSTFDLYRRAMLALKRQQEGRKPQSTDTP
ncbi:ADP-ribosylation factor-like protein 13A [Elgaria multicarinata webbii]|uniref:ADP-ribosylation factor-like protein 13A n=1 Tax=Elgaria multicarinata webbii TaxID=159646 RepID=UPI002FCCEC27